MGIRAEGRFWTFSSDVSADLMASCTLAKAPAILGSTSDSGGGSVPSPADRQGLGESLNTGKDDNPLLLYRMEGSRRCELWCPEKAENLDVFIINTTALITALPSLTKKKIKLSLARRLCFTV